MTESYLMLNQMLEDLDSIDGIIFFSLFMLPKSFHHRELILNSILDSGKQIHFATEDMIINNFDQVSSLNNIFLVREVAAKGNFKENLQTALRLTQNT